MIKFTKDDELNNILHDILKKYSITTLKQQAAFLATIDVESNNFNSFVENLNYSANRLCAVWPNRFKTLDEANVYAKNPEKLASYIYCNRMGNGDEESRDGWIYRGRGAIQLTGKNNYKMIADKLSISINEAVEYIETKRGAIESAAIFWTENNLNHISNSMDMWSVTKVVNGGFTGINSRITKYKYYYDMLKKDIK